MRLNPFNTNNINVRSSGGGVPGGKAGGIGCGTIVIAAIGYFVFGLDPMQTAGMVEGVVKKGVGLIDAGGCDGDGSAGAGKAFWLVGPDIGHQAIGGLWIGGVDGRQVSAVLGADGRSGHLWQRAAPVG